jgi:hypothetical protein
VATEAVRRYRTAALVSISFLARAFAVSRMFAAAIRIDLTRNPRGALRSAADDVAGGVIPEL